MVGWDLIYHINHPAKHDFLHAPDDVAFAKLLERYWFLACSVIFRFWAEEFINGAEEVPCNMTSLVWPSLHYTDEVIEVYFDMC